MRDRLNDNNEREQDKLHGLLPRVRGKVLRFSFDYAQDVAHQPLPVGGKAQLISAAATQQERGGKNTLQTSTPIPDDLISWAMVYCVDRKISMARIVT